MPMSSAEWPATLSSNGTRLRQKLDHPGIDRAAAAA
jgi:hypothetical protein